MTTRRGLTKKQADTLRFVGAYFATHGFAPTYEAIAIGLGMSPKSRSAIGYGIKRLVTRGYVVSIYGVRQSIALTEEGKAYCKDFPGTAAPILPGARQQPQQTKQPCAVDGAAYAYNGQGRRAGIHFRPVTEGQA